MIGHILTHCSLVRQTIERATEGCLGRLTYFLQQIVECVDMNNYRKVKDVEQD